MKYALTAASFLVLSLSTLVLPDSSELLTNELLLTSPVALLDMNFGELDQVSESLVRVDTLLPLV